MPDNGEQAGQKPRLIIEFEGPGSAGCTISGLDGVSPAMLGSALLMLDTLAHDAIRGALAQNARRPGIVVPMRGHLNPGGVPRA